MNWKFEQETTSTGGLFLKALRNTGNEVSLRVDEHERYRIYQEAFYLEVSLGTLPSKALYIVISSLKILWLSKYNEVAFGSWLVASPDGIVRYVYDGKALTLKYYCDEAPPEWQYRIEQKNDVTKEVFSSLA